MPTLQGDANLDRARQFEGYKVLPPCVLYGKIGQGGMGAVYRGRHLNLDIDVAVKCLKPELVGNDDQFVVRFRREARSAAQINHQNVVRVFDVSEEKGLHYIVMELVKGETSRDRVQRKGRLKVGEALEILYGAALGLGEAHRKGFIHRDVKPDNIMISSSGQVKVADLGLAKPSAGSGNASLLSGTNVVMGTPQYMPPEQWENTATVTPAADVWALGATLYYLLVGGEAIGKDSLPRIMQRIVLQPFPDVRERRDDVPEDVALLIAKATERRPEDRYADATELAEAIEQMATRRESLRDRDAGTTTNQSDTLLSPPPAQTLAKIKFWLDAEAQRGGDRDGDRDGVTVVTPSVDGANVGGTMPMAPPRPAAAGRTPLLVIVVLLLVGAGMFWWRPWQAGRLFAEVDRLAAAGQYELAIAETLRVHANDPSLSGKDLRLARLHREWAQSLMAADDLRPALRQLRQSLAYAEVRETRQFEKELLARVARVIDAALERTAPTAEPIARGDEVEFRGRLESDLVQGLSIGGLAIERAADGSFRQRVRLAGRDSAEVRVLLVPEGTVALPPWPVVYLAPLPPLAVTLSPASLELVGDGTAELTVKGPAGASVRLDGEVAGRIPTEGELRVPVRSDLATPQAVRVRVEQDGAAPFEQQVAVTRRLLDLEFAQAPVVVEARQVPKLGLVAKGEQVTLAGRVRGGPAELRVDGVLLADVEWQEDGAFRGRVGVRLGANRLVVTAARRFCKEASSQIEILRIDAPQLTVAEGTRLEDRVESPNYNIAIAADEYTERVYATCRGTRAQLARDPGGRIFRGRVTLLLGDNRIQIEGFNVIEESLPIEIRVERVAAGPRADGPVAQVPVVDADPNAATTETQVPTVQTPVPTATAAPVLRSVSCQRDGEAQRVKSKGTLFIAGDVTLLCEVTDAPAECTMRDVTMPVGADGSVSLAPILGTLTPLRAEKVELVFRNERGTSTPFVFFVVLDNDQPSVVAVAPLQPVAVGQPFEVSGTWTDGLGVGSVTVDGQVATLSPTNGIKAKGNWLVKHPGLTQSGDLQVVVRDLAGNEATSTVHVEVR